MALCASVFKVLIFPVRNCLLGSPCLVTGHPAELRQRASCGGIPNARDLHAGPCILQISGTLTEVYQGICQHSMPLYDVLGKEVKMGPVDLHPEAQEAVDILKRKIQSVPILVFPDFDKSFLLDTDASKEGLGAVLSQKQGDGHYHPVTFGSSSLIPSEKNYHSSKLEFLALKWSVTEHFKEYLAYSPFVV